MSIKFTDIVNKLPASVPFVGPEAQERSIDQLFKARIGANESVFGPSEKAISAMKKHLSEVWMYGDPENFDLKHALAKKHKVNFENTFNQIDILLTSMNGVFDDLESGEGGTLSLLLSDDSLYNNLNQTAYAVSYTHLTLPTKRIV